MLDQLDQHPDWLFDESTHVGVDYADKDLVADYDRQHNGFRDFQKEAERIVDLLALAEDSTVLDIGCGTGGLSACLARKCRHIHAVDVSLAMVDTLKNKMIR